jgi:uncharacterized OB-fold protein
MISPVKIWRNQKKTRPLLGKVGTILSWSKVLVPPAGFSSQAPYIIVIVSRDQGSNMICQLVDYDEKDLKIGMKVVTVLRKTRESDTEGIIPYGVKVKPL